MVKSLNAVIMVVLAAKYPNVFRRSYGTQVEGKRSTTIPMSGYNTKIRVEIPNSYNNRSTAQSQMEWVRIP